jgi:hypothetical protein
MSWVVPWNKTLPQMPASSPRGVGFVRDSSTGVCRTCFDPRFTLTKASTTFSSCPVDYSRCLLILADGVDRAMAILPAAGLHILPIGCAVDRWRRKMLVCNPCNERSQLPSWHDLRCQIVLRLASPTSSFVACTPVTNPFAPMLCTWLRGERGVAKSWDVRPRGQAHGSKRRRIG